MYRRWSRVIDIAIRGGLGSTRRGVAVRGRGSHGRRGGGWNLHHYKSRLRRESQGEAGILFDSSLGLTVYNGNIGASVFEGADVGSGGR